MCGNPSRMWFFVAIVIFGSVLVTAWYYWKPFFENDRVFKQSQFVAWAIKGLAAPTVLWIVMNTGAMWSFGPFMPEVSVAKNAAGGGWIDVLLDYIGRGMIVLASFWLALSLGWLLGVLIKSVPEENRPDLKAHTIFWSVVTIPVAALILLLGGWTAGGFATSLCLLPIVHCTSPLLVKRKTYTFYSGAIARMKMGKFEEAEAEILRQLEECEDDFEGWMMLAELYARHFGDLDTADQTVRDLCAQPDLNPGQVYTALNRLADWHLTLGDDPVAARNVLEVIRKAYAGTHLARLAHTRMAQLPRTRAELLEQRQGRKIRLPSLRDDIDSESSELPRLEAAAAANECVNRLKVDPDDVATREKLARLFAEQLGRADLGIEQTKLLLEIPNQPAGKMAEWLAQIATWQLKYLRDSAAGQQTLQRLITEYPQSAQAFAAQRRLNLIDAESRLRRKPAGRLGS